MICNARQRWLIVHIFTEQGFLADVYLNDVYKAKYSSLASLAFPDSVISPTWTGFFT